MQINRLVLAALLGLSVLAGCGDDDPVDTDGAVDEGGNHELESPTCQAISDACHSVDTGVGEIGMCHEIAHADVEAECSEHELHCIPLCEAAAADGGGHDEDGGHEEH